MFRRRTKAVGSVVGLAVMAALLPVTAANAATGDDDTPLVVAYGSPNIGTSSIDPLWDTVPFEDVSQKTGGVIATAQFKAYWDENYLYTLTKVTDPYLDNSSGALYNQDSVEVFVDTHDDKSAAHSTYVSQQDFQFRVSYTNTTSFDHGGDDRLISNARQTDDGYVVESVFRLGDLDTGQLAEGRKLGFDVQINDGRNGNRIGQLFWHDGTGNQWQRPNLFGSIELGPRPTEVPAHVSKIALFYAISQTDKTNRSLYDNASVLDQPYADAKAVFADDAATQAQVDAAQQGLSDALWALNREGPYPDPKRLPKQEAMPDLFTFLDGSKVQTVADWQRRQDEIAGEAQYYEYGYKGADPTTLAVTRGADTANNNATISMTNQVDGATVNGTFSVSVQYPSPDSGYSAPYPVVIGFGGVPDADTFHKNGIATISFDPNSVASESHTGLYYNFFPYQKDVVGSDTGALMAWAWGVSRVVDAIDYLDPGTGARLFPELDPNGIAVTGHSRYGKGALVSGAFDKRIAIANPNGSGTAGASSWRYQFYGKDYSVDNGGEPYPWATTPEKSVNSYVEHIKNSFGGNPAWFTNLFGDFQEPDTVSAPRLPFDQDSILALMAPRPVLVTGGFSDFGTNPESMALSFKAAEKAYQFLGDEDLIGIALHDGGHTQGPEDVAHLLDMIQYHLRGITTPAVVGDIQAMHVYPFHTYDPSTAPWDVPAQPTLQVTPARTVVNPGATVDVTLALADKTTVRNATASLTFDADAFTLAGVDPVDAAHFAVSDVTTNGGTLTATLAATGESAGATGLVVVHLSPKGDQGSSDLAGSVTYTQVNDLGYASSLTVTGTSALSVGYSVDDLRALVDRAAAADQSHWTTSTWGPFAHALAGARDVVGQGSPAPADVSAAFQALTSAYAALAPRGDPYVLGLYVSVYDKLDPSSYTPASWQPFAAALDAAKGLVAQPEDATASDLSAALTALQDAADGLRAAGANTVALGVYVEEAQRLLADSDRYVPSAVAKLRTVLAQAQDVLASGSDQAAVDKATNDLFEAITAVVPKGDTTTLSALVAAAARLDDGQFTATSWDALSTALKGARYVVADQDAGVEEVDLAQSTLDAALRGLVVRADTAALRAQITLTQHVLADSARYVPATLDGLADALSAAQAVAADVDATQAAVDDATRTLAQADAKVRLKADLSVLKAILGQADKVDVTAFSVRSATVFRSAYQRADALTEDSPQATVDTAVTDLQTAIAGLEPLSTSATGGHSPKGSGDSRKSSGDSPKSGSSKSGSSKGGSDSPKGSDSPHVTTSAPASQPAAGKAPSAGAKVAPAPKSESASTPTPTPKSTPTPTGSALAASGQLPAAQDDGIVAVAGSEQLAGSAPQATQPAGGGQQPWFVLFVVTAVLLLGAVGIPAGRKVISARKG